MTTRLRYLLASLALSSAIVARAESVSGPSVPARTLSPILAALDTDHNRTLSASEIAAAPLTLAALDTNGDGKITSDEWRTRNSGNRTGRVAGGATAFNVVLTLDANNDGDIQTLEIANAVSSLKRLDLNGDGELSPDELRPAVTSRTRIQSV